MKVTDDHYIDGEKKYDRVTKVLSLLPSNLDKVPAGILEQAKARGDYFHKSAALYNNMKMQGRLAEKKIAKWLDEIRLDPDIGADFAKYIEWIETMVVRFVLIETHIKSEADLYAGTPDFIAELRNKKGLAVVDIKCATSWDLFKARLQTAAYQYADAELAKEIKQRVILPVKNIKTLKPVFLTEKYSDIGDHKLWLSCLSLYRAWRTK